MDDACSICGAPGEDDHHLTGRGADGEYLDPDLKVPACHDDHELVGEDLRAEGLEKPLRQTTIVERIAYRLDRVGIFLTRVAEQAPFCWAARLASAVRRWAAELRSFITALDAWNPVWRAVPGVT